MEIRSHTATNVDVQGLFVRMYIVRFWGDVPRSGVSGSYGNCFTFQRTGELFSKVVATIGAGI